MNMQATNGALQARKELLKEAKRMRLDAYMTGETVRVYTCNGGWRIVTSGRTLGQVKGEFTRQRLTKRKAKRKAMLTSWMTRSTRHPFAY